MPNGNEQINTAEITIEGQVQGVGFRPFIYSLAQSLSLTGQVFNDEVGVKIHLNASNEEATTFLQKILDNPPVNARIEHHNIQSVALKAFDDFQITTSNKAARLNLPLTPDFAVCEQCKTEITDKENRRYYYPFTTCINCGPRYAITKSYPFEREHTSIVAYNMCADCEHEYTNPADRRFHSQTNSCSQCGIQVWLDDNEGNRLETGAQNAIKKAAHMLKEGGISVIKNTNGYLLCCDARNASAIQRLRERKRRPKKPLAVLYKSMVYVKKEFSLSESEEKELQSSTAPIVILEARGYSGELATQAIAPNLNQIGVMLPNSGLLHLLMHEIDFPIVATSGNIHGSPIISNQADAESLLSKVADCFLHHDLDIITPQDDSVVKFSKENNQKIILRRSRGLAPNYWGATGSIDEAILAMGAHLKSTVAFSPNAHTYLSQYLGNLDSYEVNQRLEKCVNHYVDLFEVAPKTILVDQHPSYQSTVLGHNLSEQWSSNIISVQHHKAHFASILGEHELFGSNDKTLGVIWDGTGWGDDGNVWGGELFTYQNQVIDRLTHFEYFDWLAGDKMAKEPRLSLFSLLEPDSRAWIKDKFNETEWRIYNQLLSQNKLKTSSVGRLFDAVACALGLTDINHYEGEAAMLLENIALEVSSDTMIDYLGGASYMHIPTRKIIHSIMADLSDEKPTAQIARNFLYTLACTIIRIASKQNASSIAVSGGVFQNAILHDILFELTQNKFKLLYNTELSSNDENIALGQLFYYQNIKE